MGISRRKSRTSFQAGTVPRFFLRSFQLESGGFLATKSPHKHSHKDHPACHQSQRVLKHPQHSPINLDRLVNYKSGVNADNCNQYGRADQSKNDSHSGGE